MTIELSKHGYRRSAPQNVWLRSDDVTADFGYNDGDEYETWVGQVIRDAADVSAHSREITHGIRDWPSRYHLSPQRANLVQPMLGTIQGPVLEIGAGMGAVTRAIGELGHELVAVEGSPRRAAICADRCRGLPNVQVVSDTIQGFDVGGAFATVVMIGVLEYSRAFGLTAPGRDPVDLMLEHVVSLLAPGGQLILAIENQLGLKYFAGFPEDHLGRRMFGIEDRYSETSAVTFGRRELGEHLTRAGLDQHDWYFPFPDYKLPTAILSERGLQPGSTFDPSPIVASSVRADHQHPGTTVFDLERTWRVASRNGLVADLANSFLVRASAAPLSPPVSLAWYFGTASRRPEFAKTTTFDPSEEGIIVRRRRQDDSLVATLDGFSNTLADEKYRPGHLLTEVLEGIVARDGWQVEDLASWFATWFVSFLDAVDVGATPSSEAVVPGTFIDAMPRNLIVDGGATAFIDLEWSSAEPQALSYMVFRALFDSLASLGSVAPPAEGTPLLLRDLVVGLAATQGIDFDEPTLRAHWERERTFQSTVLGSDIAVSLEQALGTSLTVHRDADSIIRDADALEPATQELGQLREELGQLRDEIERRGAAIARMDGDQERAASSALEAESLRLQLDAVQRTVSWRITRPVRTARRMLSRLKAVLVRIIRSTTRDRGVATTDESFDPSYYRARYADLRDLDDDALRRHYAAPGQSEGRHGHAIQSTPEVVVRAFDPQRETVLVVFHDASRTGAPVLGWNLVGALGDERNVVAVLMGGGELASTIAETAAATVTLKTPEALDQGEADVIANEINARFSPVYAIANSAATYPLIPALERSGIPVVALVHEFTSSIRPYGVLSALFDTASEIVFSAEIVADSMRSEYTSLLARDHHIIAQGQSVLPPGPARAPVARELRRGPDGVPADLPEVTLEHFLSALDPATVLVVGAGTVAPRKGIEFFIQTAQHAHCIAPSTPIAFAWIGDRVDALQWYVDELFEQVARSGASERVTFLAPAPDLAPLYGRADIFFLSSRLDPLPNVTIDAALAGVPVVAFEGASGFADWLLADGPLRDLVVPHLDAAAAGSLIASLAGDRPARDRYGAALRAAARDSFDMTRYAANLDALGRSARRTLGRAADDAAVIMASGDFATHRYPGPDGAADLEAHVAAYVNQSRLVAPRARPRTGLLVPRPADGFHPLAYAEQAPGYDEDRDGDPFADFLRKGKPVGPWAHEVIRPAETAPSPPDPPLRILVHGHFHYPELVEEFAERLAPSISAVDVVVTSTSSEKAAQIEETVGRLGLNTWRVQVVPNRGRDMGPLLTGIGAETVQDYDLLLHVHGKRSLHVTDSMSDLWRDFLWENLIGGGARMLDRIHGAFADDPSLGLVFPQDPGLSDWDLNRPEAELLTARLGITTPLPTHFDFPIGNMFWARCDAIRPLFDAGFRWEEYPEEPVPIDGTMLHALERLTPFVASERGYRYAMTAVPGITR